MFDLIVKGDRVVTPHGVGAYDIGVADGRIAAIAEPGGLGAEANKVVDATGKILSLIHI